jgi:hypothetical protein
MYREQGRRVDAAGVFVPDDKGNKVVVVNDRTGSRLRPSSLSW